MSKVTFQDFLNKVKQKQESKVKILDLEVSSLGCSLTFTRPSDDELLDYSNEMANSVTVNANKEIVDQDMKKMYKASKSLVYSCCNYLKEKELQEELKPDEPWDVVEKIFDQKEVLELATDIYKAFANGDIGETIKNL
ncbi:hypothetical protein [Clostridium magnum]|uniref:Phage XkdN-like protein n=1 Tax=Clostridium magnum DSM 2767 TaxID=1121326 RepID=A0A168E1S8_9CLOT|nr:hypothetical protein [Clostridium magnum]KZL93557.1 hypothetical protein CLMAG_06030 [Clostridium magnum DSM 2767]SHI60621.1 hypothetical protein SAMN02745944_04573 [Clostridium magnum DSM 2767]